MERNNKKGDQDAMSIDEMERRKEIVRQAAAHSRIEGLRRSPETDDIFAAYIKGEIPVTEVRHRIKERLGLK